MEVRFSGGVFGFIVLAAMIWAIINIVQSHSTSGKKALWILFIVFLPVIGLIVWFFAGPREAKA